jgi:hypothetical protein
MVKSDTKYADLLPASDAPGSSVTLQAQWTLEGTYAVKYDANQATVIIKKDTATVIATIPDKTLKEWEEAELLPDLSNIEIKRTGYHLKTDDANNIIWTVVENGHDVVEDNTDPLSSHGDDQNVPYIVMQAQWEPNLYTVVYDPAGGLLSDDDDVQSNVREQVLWWTEDLLPPADPVKLGSTFMGWIQVEPGVVEPGAVEPFADDAPGEIRAMAVGSTVSSEDKYQYLVEHDGIPAVYLRALWELKNYEIHYDLGGGKAVGTVLPKTGVVWEEDGLVPGITMVKDGHKFLGWIVSEHGSDQAPQTVSAAHLFSELALDDNVPHITLQAIWERIPASDHASSGGDDPSAPSKGGKHPGTGLVEEDDLKEPLSGIIPPTKTEVSPIKGLEEPGGDPEGKSGSGWESGIGKLAGALRGGAVSWALFICS